MENVQLPIAMSLLLSGLLFESNGAQNKRQ